LLASQLQSLLDTLYHKYNRVEFIESDPISVPHLYAKKQDIEIAAFIAAIFAWGQRTTIINKSKELLSLMDNDPHQFVLHSSDAELKRIVNFKHRTFNDTDALYFIEFLRHHYKQYDSLEMAFCMHKATTMEERLINFRSYFFSLPDFPLRTQKHISSPANLSTCKRINMFLRWMVRIDTSGVDFGIWRKIKTEDLIIPIDVHVNKVANQLGLLKQEKINWNTAVQLTNSLKAFDAFDPVKYDFALFGLGIEQKNRLKL
jgi:uncharacterized protein (TIGR02757 family)